MKQGSNARQRLPGVALTLPWEQRYGAVLMNGYYIFLHCLDKNRITRAGKKWILGA